MYATYEFSCTCTCIIMHVSGKRVIFGVPIMLHSSEYTEQLLHSLMWCSFKIVRLVYMACMVFACVYIHVCVVCVCACV